MKRSLIIGALLLLARPSFAWWEVKDNPDRFISFGVKLDNTHFAGSTNNLLNPNQSNETLEPQSKNGNNDGYGFDVRLPFTKFMTFSASYDKFHLDSETIRGANTWQNHDSINSERVTLGFRLYLAN